MTPRSWVSVGLQCWAAPDVLKAVIASRRVEQATSTLAIAIYGAVIATLSLGWQVFRELRDTGRLGVTLLAGHTPRSPARTSPTAQRHEHGDPARVCAHRADWHRAAGLA